MEVPEACKDNPDLFHEWYEVMNYLYNIALKNFDKVGNELNAIQIKDWDIAAYFINDKYIKVEVTKDGTCMLEVRHDENLKQLAVAVFAILCDGEKCLHKS